MKIDENKVNSVVRLNPKGLVVVADTTFFSHANGLIVFREPNLKKSVWWSFVQYERADSYWQGKNHLAQNGFNIKAVVLDGRPGIRAVFNDIPVQMCQFHQKQIIRRYLTARPRLEASRELKVIVDKLSSINEQNFSTELTNWHERWVDFLKQKTIDQNTDRWFYTHKRLRSAYRSLNANLPYLFTYQKFPELNIPNTTNSLDGFFNRLKSLIYVHRGLNAQRRKRIIVEILKGRNYPNSPTKSSI